MSPLRYDDAGLAGKAALITGAARGQGRSHALALASAGVSVVAVDCCRQIPSVPYPLATADELADTVTQAKEAGGACIGLTADVRLLTDLDDAVAQGMSAFGRLDVVIANAGVAQGFPEQEECSPEQIWADYVAVNLTGVWNTLQACKAPLLDGGRGGSIIITNSTSGLKGMSRGDPRSDAYTASKHGTLGLMKAYANELGPHGVRVNCVAPTAVDTPMINNPAMTAWVEHTTRRGAGGFRDAMNVGRVQASDITEAVLWLASDAARYVTGVCLPVDAGFVIT
jgi:SDR family mycofactocin-dependent oxidoreductase